MSHILGTHGNEEKKGAGDQEKKGQEKKGQEIRRSGAGVLLFFFSPKDVTEEKINWS